MGQGQNQIFQWSAEAAQVYTELRKVNQEIANLGKQFVKVQAQSAQGSAAAAAQSKQLLSQLQAELNARETLRKKMQEIQGVQGQVTGSSRIMNAQIMAGAFAIDDFLTVATQQNWSNMGMVNGLAAAANNVSLMLAMINPMLAILPALGVALLKVGVRMFDGVEKPSEDAANSLEKLLDKIGDFEQSVKNIGKSQRELEDQRAAADFSTNRAEADDAVRQASISLESARREAEIQFAKDRAGMFEMGASADEVKKAEQEIEINDPGIQAARDRLGRAQAGRDKLVATEEERKKKRAEERTKEDAKSLVEEFMPAMKEEMERVARMPAAAQQDFDFRMNQALWQGGGFSDVEKQAIQEVLTQAMKDAQTKATVGGIAEKFSGDKGVNDAKKRLSDIGLEKMQSRFDRRGRNPSREEREIEKREQEARLDLEKAEAERDQRNATEGPRMGGFVAMLDELKKLNKKMDEITVGPKPKANANR